MEDFRNLQQSTGSLGFYVLNIITTSIFIIAHTIIMMIVFDFWDRGQDVPLLVWSILQYSLAIYSFMLTLGSAFL